MEEKKNDYLVHHGIRGQKWGIRRYQNSDGSLTDEGKKRYLDSNGEFHMPYKKNIFGKKQYSEEDQKVSTNYNRYVNKETQKEYDKILKMKKGSKERYQAEEQYLKSATTHDPTFYDAARYATLSDKIYDNNMDFRSKTMRKASDKKSDIYNKKRDLYTAFNRKYDDLPLRKRLRAVDNDPDYIKGEKIYDDMYKSSKSKLDSLTLKELGFTDSETNREYARYIWEWD